MVTVHHTGVALALRDPARCGPQRPEPNAPAPNAPGAVAGRTRAFGGEAYDPVGTGT
ncbi:hypothetical protein GCM10022220_09770 [Actinocatenispora rupis]|uniref:Uncharacterized protein n=1 Tax=Actinocatenispora rupis TaxID=519421 RepID=A0A8J3N879_9ACTN|nr:hypothetical protein Aru02nite_09130 [Actinocatenispora rupis]